MVIQAIKTTKKIRQDTPRCEKCGCFMRKDDICEKCWRKSLKSFIKEKEEEKNAKK